MKKTLIILSLLATFVIPILAQANVKSVSAQAISMPELLLSYNKPASTQNAALPLANGELMTLVAGATSIERLQLFDATLWAATQDQKATSASVNPLGFPFRNIAELTLNFTGHTAVKDYSRNLDLSSGVSTIRYSVKGVTYTRSYLASISDSVIVLNVKASKPGSISMSITLKPVAPQATALNMDGELVLSGSLPTTAGSSGNGKTNGVVVYRAEAKPYVKKGRCFIRNNTYTIEKADEVTIYISTATSYDRTGQTIVDESYKSNRILNRAFGKEFDQLKQNHKKIYSSRFGAVSLSLGASPVSKKALEQRLTEFKPGLDVGLSALYYQYGRYLQLTCVNPSGRPLATNMANLLLPNELDSLLESRYGMALPFWPSSYFSQEKDISLRNTWIALNICELYHLTGDPAFLKNQIPLLKDELRSWMLPELLKKEELQTTYAPLANELFSNVLSIGEDFSGGLKKLFDRSGKPFLDSLQRTAAVYQGLCAKVGEVDQSSSPAPEIKAFQLYGLYPGTYISPYRTPALASQAFGLMSGKQTESVACTAARFARLYNGEQALESLQLSWGSTSTSKQPSMLSNLLDAGSGNKAEACIGSVSAVNEMLLQSHDGFVFLLPALPSLWKDGWVSGLPATGGFLFDLTWKNGKLETVRIHATRNSVCRIRSASALVGKSLKNVKAETLPASTSSFTLPVTFLYELKLVAGESTELKKMQ